MAKHDQSLSELVKQLSAQFDECLETILDDSQTKSEQSFGQKNDGLDTCITPLKTTIQDLKHGLGDFRFKALGHRDLDLKESIALLRRDIEIKQQVIDSYSKQIEDWTVILPALEKKSKQVVCMKTNDKDFGNGTLSNTEDDNDDDDDDDDDDNVVFEQV
ncbi:hypothetical protein CLU79DRAFT_891730 [Phycomyces nitens]|nr:hypothetical protein CLU79DRAFT_891730 [Phycomyces nitens]